MTGCSDDSLNLNIFMLLLKTSKYLCYYATSKENVQIIKTYLTFINYLMILSIAIGNGIASLFLVFIP